MDFAKFFGRAFDGNPAVMALTIATLFFIFYYAISVMARNNAKWMIFAFVVYTLATGIAFIMINTEGEQSQLYFFVPIIFVLAITCMFATEIKRDVWGVGSKKPNDFRHLDKAFLDQAGVNKNIDEIVKALQNMSKNDIGAIIILSNGNVPKNVIDSGEIIDAEISAALIGSIFFPKTPLHDGAMIINGSKIEAAGCFLPLPQNADSLPKELGTRHRAGKGITEAVDVTAFVVSEETGIITIFEKGNMERYADTEKIVKRLKEYYWQNMLGQSKNNEALGKRHANDQE